MSPVDKTKLAAIPEDWHSAIETIHSVEDFVQWATPKMEVVDLYYGHGSENAEDEVAWIGSFIADFVREDFVDGWERLITVDQVVKGMHFLHQRITTKRPLGYILGQAWFAGYRFDIDERALIPRSHLGEWIPDNFMPWIPAEQTEKTNRILDLCCGGGCIGIAATLYTPGASLTLADLSEDALAVAKKNVARYNMEETAEIVHGNLYENIEGKFDLILTNPPYVVEQAFPNFPEEYHYEPKMAFVAGNLGLDIIIPILAKANDYLNDNGHLVMEAGTAAPALQEAYKDIPFTWLMSDSGEAVVLLMTKAECEKYQARFEQDAKAYG